MAMLEPSGLGAADHQMEWAKLQSVILCIRGCGVVSYVPEQQAMLS